jgi:SOS-response transcriptional repressor LexA
MNSRKPYTYISVKKNMPVLLTRPELAEVARKLKALRTQRGWNQSELADACGVTQTQISRWEHAQDRPGATSMAKLAQMSTESDRDWWLAEAGLSSLTPIEVSVGAEVRLIPLLRDPAAAGTPRAIDENAVERQIPFPSDWLPPGGKIYALKIMGDSMSPMISPDTIVLVDVAQRDAEKLVGRMVAAREGDGVTIKWLRKDQDIYMLVPQYASLRHPVRIIRPEGDFSIVGVVVKWIGEPPIHHGVVLPAAGKRNKI